MVELTAGEIPPELGIKKSAKIWWTLTDEAPALATHAFLPVVRRFLGPSGVSVETADISLAARILAAFPERLTPAQRRVDVLAKLGELAKTSRANIIKLPNVSASVYQLEQAISELNQKGFDVPKYPSGDALSPEDAAIKARYGKVIGSAVNPVLREGNSDRRVAGPVKDFARANPHRLKDWSGDSKTEVKSMPDDDFFGSEKSSVRAAAGSLRVELHAADGSVTVLKDGIPVAADEIFDAARLSRAKLGDFVEAELQRAT